MTDLQVSLVTFAVIATLTPGGATILATASGAQFGIARSLPLIGGIAFGLASLIGIVGGGLGTVILSLPELQLVLRVAGSVYLLWLAWTIACLGAPNSKAGPAAAPMGFVKGLLLLWLNPKAWTMAVAAAAAYAGLSDGPLRLALALGGVFGLAATLSLTLWCMGGLWLSRTLKTERQWRIVNVALGLLLAASVVPMWR
ncbi:LysE family transporter [Bosea sp. LjRoot90]|uniref:LysE family translocator n=1 Tax=Bosea sp. LjRoot90 TaxID=3342342 RepID=UPI003ED02CD6